MNKFKLFPRHWEVLPFTSAVRDATSGNVKIPKGEYLDIGEIPIVDQGKALFGGFTDNHKLICKSKLPTIIFGDHTRAFKYVEQSFVLGADGAKVLEPIAQLDKKFLFYYFKTLRIESAGYSRHYKFLKESFIPVPPLDEQKRIAAILDKADALRRKRQQAIELAEQFLRSVFLDMFGDPVTNPKGWEERTISEGVKNIESGWSANGDSSPASTSQLGVLKISSVTSGIFRAKENKAVELDSIPANKKLLKPRLGDLLFSRANTRELVAATAIVEQDYDNLFLSDKLWRIETNEDLLPEFLHYLLKQPKMRGRLTSQATGTSGSMLNISKRKFEETHAIFPPVEEQRRFAKVMNSIKTVGKLGDKSTNEMEDLFMSLSQHAFSGQL